MEERVYEVKGGCRCGKERSESGMGEEQGEVYERGIGGNK